MHYYVADLRLRSRSVLVAQIANTIVILDHALILTLDNRADISGKFLVQRLAIILLRDIFAAFAFFQDRVVRAMAHCRLYVHPAAVQRAATH